MTSNGGISGLNSLNGGIPSTNEETLKKSITKKVMDWQDEYQQKVPQFTDEEKEWIKNHSTNTANHTYGYRTGYGAYGEVQQRLTRIDNLSHFKEKGYKVGDVLQEKGEFRSFSSEPGATMSKLQNAINNDYVIYRTNGPVNYFPLNSVTPKGWYDYEKEVWVNPNNLKITKITTIDKGDVYHKTIDALQIDYRLDDNGNKVDYKHRDYQEDFKELPSEHQKIFNEGKIITMVNGKKKQDLPPKKVTIVDLEPV